MKLSVVLLPFVVFSTVLMGETVAKTQTYQPSNRVPVADGTLGTQVLGGNGNFGVVGGVSKGQNLFHSFQDFSVPTGGAVTFVNPVGTQSIITRVTGGVFSDVNGSISSQGANFFLINPSGVVFGPGVQLNVGRVFAASTANGIDMVDGAGRAITFGVNASDAPLLAINPDVLFNVSRFNLGGGSGEIRNFGVLQTGNANQYIGLIGGNIVVDRGQINAPGGRVELGGLSEPGSVRFGIEGNSSKLDFPVDVTRSNVLITEQSTVNVADAGNGEITVNARNIGIAKESIVRGGIEQELGTPKSIAGDINLNATNEIVVESNSRIANSVRFASKGTGGNIIIDTASFSLRENSQLQAATLGEGNTGNVNIAAKDFVSIVGASIFSVVTPDGIGDSGNINISVKAGPILIQDGSQLYTSTHGVGSAGKLVFTARDNISLLGSDTIGIPSKVANTIENSAVGNSGGISFESKSGSIILNNGTSIESEILGTGSSGKITLTAKDSVFLSGVNVFGSPSQILSSIKNGATGNAGEISLRASSGSIILNDGALISSLTSGKGSAGNIDVTANESISLSSSRISSVLDADGNGNGGDVNVTVRAGSLNLNNGSKLQTIIQGELFGRKPGVGSAGNLTVNASGDIRLSGANLDRFSSQSEINSSAGNSALGTTGNAGVIDITSSSGSVILEDGAIIDSSTNGAGGAGNIVIKAENGSVKLSGSNALGIGSAISSIVQPSSTGAGGNIVISVDSLLLKNGASIESSSLGIGDFLEGEGIAGNIEINSKKTIFLEGEQGFLSSRISSILGFMAQGRGGDITVSSTDGSIVLREGAQIDSSTFGTGNAGNVVIKAINGSLSLSENSTLGFNSRVSSRVIRGAEGRAGSIIIDSNSVSLEDGALIDSSTSGTGNAGSIRIKASNSVSISGVANRDLLNPFSGLYVDSQSTNGVAGDISVNSPKIILDNNGKIEAISSNGDGGNIRLNISSPIDSAQNQQVNFGQVPDPTFLLLRRGAQISTSAAGSSQQGGNGGNISINSNLIVAIPNENSDISANAVRGRGGNVNINSQGLFGIQNRPQQTSNSDITASSDFGQTGNISINTPGIDPGKDKGELPAAPTDASNQISRACSPSQIDNKFYITGRGGHPANIDDQLTNDVVWRDPRSTQPTNPPKLQTVKPIQPAVGLVFDGKGKATLVAANPEGEITRTRIACPTR